MIDQLRRRKRIDLDTHTCRHEVMTVLPNKHYKGQYRATQIEGDQRTPGEEIFRKKWGQQDSSTAGRIWRWLQWTESNRL